MNYGVSNDWETIKLWLMAGIAPPRQRSEGSELLRAQEIICMYFRHWRNTKLRTNEILFSDVLRHAVPEIYDYET